MERQTYWNRRISRRRTLAGAATGGVGLAGLALAGCGGDDNGSTSLEDAPTASAQKQEEVKSILWQRTDTTAQAVKGGIYQSYYVADVTSLDPLSATSYTANYQTAYLYPTLLSWKSGFRFTPSTGELEGQLAESWQQPDATTVIFKLQPKAKWDDKLNGRAIDADDVVFSWKKYAEKGQTRLDLVNSATNPGAPITSIEAVDKSTVKFKLAFPMAAALGQLAYDRNLLIMPRESEPAAGTTNGYDPRAETRSGGPWILENYQRSVAFKFRRNPNFWNADKIWLDGIDQPIIAETAVVMAQFRAKKIWGYAPPAQDVVGLHKDLPELLVDTSAFNKACYQLDFGMQPGSPFRDPRVRQAVSMLIDRDAYIDTWGNVTNYKKEGFPVEVRYHANLSSGWDGYWVDPKGKDMGDGAKSFTLNVAEAKKLLSAAGFTGPIETDMAWIATGQYGTDFPKWAETFKGMLEADGLFKFKQVNPDYQTEYLPKYYWNKGDFKGIAVAATTIYPADPDGHMYAYYHSQGSRQKVAFQGKETIDAKSDKLIEDQRKELDAKKRVEIIKEWQRYTATQMPIIPFPGQSSGFTLYWPWAGNSGVFRDWDGESARFQQPLHMWFDKSKYTG